MQNFKNKVVAIIDSGIGGISVLNQMLKLNIAKRYVYFADNLNMPYGNKDKEFIKNRIKEIVKYLKDKHKVDEIVLACNTASTCVKDLHIEGLYILSFNKANTYLTTRLTAENLKGYKTIYDCKLASKIEKYILNNHKADKIVKRVVIKYKLNTLKTLTLGCTHFEFLADSFRKYCNTTEIKLNTEALISQLKDEFKVTSKIKPKITLVLSKPDNKLKDKIVNLIEN